jgi:hypothetical protein
MFVKVKEHKEYVRDISTNAVLNVDRSALDKHNNIINEMKRQRMVQEQINTLMDQVSEIKEMLKALSNRGS